MKCNKCGGHEIKRKLNYSHGKKSKPTVVFTCKACGSSDIESKEQGRRSRRR